MKWGYRLLLIAAMLLSGCDVTNNEAAQIGLGGTPVIFLSSLLVLFIVLIIIHKSAALSLHKKTLIKAFIVCLFIGILLIVVPSISAGRQLQIDTILAQLAFPIMFTWISIVLYTILSIPLFLVITRLRNSIHFIPIIITSIFCISLLVVILLPEGSEAENMFMKVAMLLWVYLNDKTIGL